MKISPENLSQIAHWLPKSCAYRCLVEGISLPDWHPLRSDHSPEAGALLMKVDRVCIRPNSFIGLNKAADIIRNSKPPKTMRKLTRLLLNNIIRDEEL